MKCLLKSSVLLFALSCLAHGAGAEPPATAQRAGSAVRTIVVGGETLVMKGERLIARLTDEQSTHYFYKEGRLSNVYRSDGRFASYYYDADKRLERIEFSDGQVQRAVYRAGVLVSLDSSSGQRMIMAPAPDKPVAAAGKEGQLKSAAPPGAGTAAALSAPDALNKKLLAIVGWEEKSWECRLAPDERTICIGRGGGGGGGDSGGDSGGGSGGAPYGGPGWTPGDGAPSGGGSHGGGDGGGGNGDGYGGGPRYPTNLPTRMSCLSAASETFEIMRDEVCTMVRDPTICMEQNLLLFQQLWQECIARFPH
ncbi:hypothetical protein [Massilia antarctica]|uniref:hypothetical protein n=1 Tax=Massilia antarctica TaxID=2765360 RepID=UPI0006BD8DAE|nr:hypothetical protein [Massilia sp. H27-R4]MCY0913196.1 hypothetical protein [Massilia sp. H27-R4]CUI07799.1 RNA-binding region RNP-1 (RNA recognition motif) [Janthinobacterium sp. CG23_2]CUU31585.1 RNA-binding region RNP-1 (RNA recognition motif) [Janthinobacterium sp. CG23_2]